MKAVRIASVWNNAGSVPGIFNAGWSIGICLCLLVEYPKCALCNPNPGVLDVLRNCTTTCVGLLRKREIRHIRVEEGESSGLDMA